MATDCRMGAVGPLVSYMAPVMWRRTPRERLLPKTPASHTFDLAVPLERVIQTATWEVAAATATRCPKFDVYRGPVHTPISTRLIG